MKAVKIGAACLALALSYGGSALADDSTPPQPKDWHFTLSAKGWYESWSTWQTVYTNPPPGKAGTLLNTADSRIALIGGATVRYKNLFVNGNISPSTTFNFTDVLQKYKRSENDLNVGYYIHPQVAIAVGMKNLRIEYDPSSVWKYSFVTLGFNGAAPISGTHLFFYGNGARSITGTATSSFAITGYSLGTPIYQSFETGIGYAGGGNVIYTLGYKFQQAELPIMDLTNGMLERTRDTTLGFIFGAAVTF